MGKYQFSYEEKITIIREHEENHKTLKAICEEYDISKSYLCYILRDYRQNGIENLTDPERSKKYHGAIVKDHYGRQIPKHAHGTANLDGHTSSTKKIMCAASDLFDRIVDQNLLVRRLNIVANHVLSEADAPKKNEGFEQLDLFTDYAALEVKQEQERAELEREKK